MAAFDEPLANRQRKFRLVMIGIGIWVFLIFLFLAFVIFVDWH
jgi:hypothetical protein